MELEDPRFWVLIAFVAFLALFGKKGWTALINLLDGRSARIAAELDEAKRLRQEAEVMLAQYKKRQAESLQESEGILQKARMDAESMARAAQDQLAAELAIRTRMAEEKIAQAEKQAIDDVRNAAATQIIAAAREQLGRAGGAANDAGIASAITDIERKLH